MPNSRARIRPHIMPGRSEDWRLGENPQLRQIVRLLREIEQRDQVTVTAGLYEDRPEASTAGSLYMATDGLALYRDTGEAWETYGPIAAFTPPVNDDFAWVNEGTATVSETAGGLFLLAPHSAATSLRVRKKAAQATPWTVTAYLLPLLANKASHSAELLFREAGTGEIHTFGYVATGTTINLRSTKFTSATALSANYESVPVPRVYPWLRIADNGTNRVCSYSADGVSFVTFHSVARADFLTPDEVGFAVGAENAGTPNLEAGGSLLSWVEQY